MHCIDTSFCTPDSKFTDGNPSAGVRATVVDATWLNAVQTEITALIEGGGLAVTKGDNTQMLQAVRRIVATMASAVAQATTAEAGIMALATYAEALAGVVANKAIVPSVLSQALTSALAGVARLGVVNAYTRQQCAAAVERIAVSGSQAVDLETDALLYINANGNLTIADPTHMGRGYWCMLCLYSSAARTISWGSAWHGTSLAASLPTALAAGKLLVISTMCVSTPNGTYMLPVGIMQEA